METLKNIIINIDNAQIGTSEVVFIIVVLAVIALSCYFLPDANKKQTSKKA